MDKIYQEILEAIELKKENEAKIAELESKISENLAKGQEFNNRTFGADKESIEYQVELREKQKIDIESDKMRIEKQSFENEINGKIDAIKSKLQIMLAEEKLKLEDNEKKYRQNVLNNIEKNDAMENWNNFYGEELFSDVQNSDELEGYLSNVEDKSAQILDNIKKMESIYNQLSVQNIEKLSEEAEKNSKKVKEEKPKTVEQTVKTDEFKPLNFETVDIAKEQARKEQMDHMRELQEKLIQRNKKLQEEKIKETRTRICKDVFAKKEKGFEDVLTPEYENLKNSILALVDKDADGLRKIMYKISDMTLEDIYQNIISTAKKEGKEDYAKTIAKNLEKIKARREELNPQKDEAKKDEAKKDEAKKDEAKKDEAKKDEAKKDEAKKDEAKKDEAKKDKPYEKTSINIDAKNNKIVIYVKGKTQPYEVSDSEDITKFIKNGKEYKKDKEYKKTFGKKELKKVDSAILGILIDSGNIDAAKEYVASFKKGQPSLVDVKYAFSSYTVGVPMKIVNNYKDSAKAAEKRGVATVEGPRRMGPIKTLQAWSEASRVGKLENPELKARRETEKAKSKEQRKGFAEKFTTIFFDEFGEERTKKLQEYKEAKQESKAAKKEEKAKAKGTEREKTAPKTTREDRKAMEQAAERQAHFITNPKLSKDLGMGRVGLDQDKAEKFYEEMKKWAPTQEKQAENAKNFQNKGKEPKQETRQEEEQK